MPRATIDRVLSILYRPAGRPVVVVVAIVILAAPLWLFADSLRYYRVQGGRLRLRRRVAYLRARDRQPVRAAQRPHRPGVAAPDVGPRRLGGGRLSALPGVLGVATFAVVPMVMLAVGVLVGRETRSTAAGAGGDGVRRGSPRSLKSPATWYSAGQTLWAGLGVLLTLLALQSWRRSGGGWRLALSVVAAFLGGGFWTIGHVAGPAGCRLFAGRSDPPLATRGARPPARVGGRRRRLVRPGGEADRGRDPL